MKAAAKPNDQTGSEHVNGKGKLADGEGNLGPVRRTDENRNRNGNRQSARHEDTANFDE